MKLIRLIGVGFVVMTVVAMHDLDDKIVEKTKPYAALLLVKKKELDAAANQALAMVVKEAQAKAAQSHQRAGT